LNAGHDCVKLVEMLSLDYLLLQHFPPKNVVLIKSNILNADDSFRFIEWWRKMNLCDQRLFIMVNQSAKWTFVSLEIVRIWLILLLFKLTITDRLLLSAIV
jgi:hypothetical protein